MNDVDERLEWTREGLGMAAKLCGVTWAPNENGKLGKSCIFPMRIGRCTKACAICWWEEFPNTNCGKPKDHVGGLHVCGACLSDVRA